MLVLQEGQEESVVMELLEGASEAAIAVVAKAMHGAVEEDANGATGSESEITDFYLGPLPKDEALKIMPVQKQTRDGQRTRFKVSVAMGDYNGHIGPGVKCSKKVTTATRGAIILAKLSIMPVRCRYWGNIISNPHTVP
ncbi:UNVERIFIED_CONTAM: 40S ribosomal protein [Gekko kuhli]